MSTFEFVADGPAWKGVPVVNGHKILCAQKVDVSISGDGSWPVVRLHLIVPEGLKVALGADVKISAADETREALISMGWTPPAEDGK